MLLTIVFLYFLGYANAGCSLRTVNNTQICTCNATYCDNVPQVGKLSKLGMKIYETSRAVPGFTVREGNFEELTSDEVATLTLDVNPKVKYQTIVGFGGAFTDATGQNIKSLPKEVQDQLLAAYFGEDGIEYSLCRVPVGGTDFSPRPYSLDDHDGDSTLRQFALQEEDLSYKIPYVKAALNLTKGNLKLFGSAWTAPPWMKDHNVWSGYSMLKNTSYQVWADYFVKFFEKYEEKGIKFWGLTTGNEPLNGFYNYPYTKINCMGWIPELQAKWIRENLGPTLRKSPYKDVKIMIHDDSTITLPFYVPSMLNDDNTLKYIDGVATHWYYDSQMGFEIRNLAKTDKKDVFLLASEACYFMTGPIIGDWSRGSQLVESIMKHLEYNYVGWVDWNMALNYTGGFTYIDFLADAPIVISKDAKEFYKQPMFYALGHFSKFIIRGSVRLETTLKSDDLRAVAFLRPDKIKAVIILNKSKAVVPLKLNDVDRFPVVINVPAESFQTVLYSTE